MNIKSILLATAVLSLAVGASASNMQSAGGGVTAATVQKPVQIYQLLSGPTRLYYQNRNRYRSLAYANHVKIFNKFTAVSFMNTTSQPIQEIIFQLAAYSDDYRAVLDPNGQPVIKQLIASGPFTPGTKQTLVNANVVWSIPPGNGLGCVRLNGMQIVYADGSSTTVAATEVGQYLSPRISNNCGVPPSHRIAGVSRVTTGPSPYIASVYPAKWMIMREPLFRQPFVPPSNTQALCAVGSLLTETCGVAPDSSSLQD